MPVTGFRYPVSAPTKSARALNFNLRERGLCERIRGVKRFSPMARVGYVAFVLAFAAGTLCAEDSGEKKKIAGELQGYFVRVKSGVSGEKEFYYNKDGSLRSSSGDALLGGDFSLDESLLGDGDLNPEFEPEPLSDGDLAPASPAPAEKKRVPAPGGPASSPVVPAVAPEKFDFPEEEIGVVDEDATLRKFSRKRNDFGINTENFKKIVNTTLTDRYDEAVSLREWQGSSSYGIRRYDSLTGNYEMRSSPLNGNTLDLGLFETRTNLAGEKMFVRTNDGLLEVRLNGKFSSMQNMRAAERPIALRESSGFSMQDINRYQFRRNRSSDPGLSVVSPGGEGTVRKESFNGKDMKVGQ